MEARHGKILIGQSQLKVWIRMKPAVSRKVSHGMLFALVFILLGLLPPAFPGRDGIGKVLGCGAGLGTEVFPAEALERGMSGSADNRLAVLQHRYQIGDVTLIVLHGASQAGGPANLRVVVLKLLAQRRGGHAREPSRERIAGFGLG